MTEPTATGERAAGVQHQFFSTLLADHNAEWVIPDTRGKQDFRRGFVEAVGTTPQRLMDHPELLTRNRLVRELRVYNAATGGRALAELPGLERIEHLDRTNTFVGAGFHVGEFFTDARLDRVRELSLANCRLWPWTLQKLADSPVRGEYP